MFEEEIIDDKIVNVRTSESDNFGRVEDDVEDPTEDTPLHRLDTPKLDTLFRKLTSFYRQELDRQYDNRLQQAIDADFYDHIQWTEEDIAALQERGQNPTVYNVIAQTCNWIIGSEKRGRSDFKILPREENDIKGAERKTKLMKYLSDVNKTPFHRSTAFEDSVKVGLGWFEDGYQDSNDSENIYSRRESWRNMLHDSSATEIDLSDARYEFRHKWVDVDIVKAFVPDRAEIIEQSAEDGPLFAYDNMFSDEVMDQHEFELEAGTGYNRSTGDFTSRRRLRVIECWYRTPETVKIFTNRSDNFKGQIYDESNPHPMHDEYIQESGGVIDENGGISGEEIESILTSKTMMVMRVAIMTIKGLIYEGMSPYRHNRFPFTPVWAYKRDRDGMPYGVIRGLRDIQEDINKRMSKALWILSTNKVVMDEGAVKDIEKLREEVARPDAIIEKKKGRELRLDVDRELSQYQLELMSRNIEMIQQTGGVTDEMLGRTTNAVSGAAITARQEQGSLSTSKLFDNLRFAFNDQGAKQLSLVEQFMTEEKKFRITNERGTPEFVTVNDGLPENDIVRRKADFIISEGEWRASMRQAQAEQLAEMMTRMPPQVAMVMLDLVVELMDIPNRDELVGRIRQINGMSDPDADPNSPEELAKKQSQEAQNQYQQQMAEVELREKLAKAGKTEAEIQKIMSDTTENNLEAMNKAVDAALQFQGNSSLARTADTLLDESGFVSVSEKRVQQEQQMANQQLEQQAIAEEQQVVAEQGLPQEPQSQIPA